MNGNGRKDFADVVLYFDLTTWIAGNEPVSAFDNNGNSRILFAGLVWLYNHHLRENPASSISHDALPAITAVIGRGPRTRCIYARLEGAAFIAADDLAEALACRSLAGCSVAAVVGIFDPRSSDGTLLVEADMPVMGALRGEEAIHVPIAVTDADDRTVPLLITAFLLWKAELVVGALSVWRLQLGDCADDQCPTRSKQMSDRHSGEPADGQTRGGHHLNDAFASVLRQSPNGAGMPGAEC